MSAEMTMEALLQALDEYHAGEEDLEGALTVEEIAEKKGWSIRATQRKLNLMIADGLVEVGWKTGKNVVGRRIRRPAYILRG